MHPRILLLSLALGALHGHDDEWPREAIPDGTRQVVLVRPARGFEATLTAWEYAPSGWRRTAGPWRAVVGREGFAPPGAKREGDGRTPSGLFPIGLAFGRPASLPTGLRYRQATDEDYWVDDPASPAYNQWVRGKPTAASCEKLLLDSGLYDAAAVIEYNTAPVVPGRGSAIFLHVWDKDGQKGTAGCVALDRDRLAALLRWLDARASPVIVLNPSPASHSRLDGRHIESMTADHVKIEAHSATSPPLFLWSGHALLAPSSPGAGAEAYRRSTRTGRSGRLPTTLP